MEWTLFFNSSLMFDFSNYKEYFLELGLMGYGGKVMPIRDTSFCHTLGLHEGLIPRILGSKNTSYQSSFFSSRLVSQTMRRNHFLELGLIVQNWWESNVMFAPLHFSYLGLGT